MTKYKSMVPPLGAKPRFIWEEERIDELQKAIGRFIHANYPIPFEFVLEYNELVEKLDDEPKTMTHLAELKKATEEQIERIKGL